jgi:hypothetical protein
VDIFAFVASVYNAQKFKNSLFSNDSMVVAFLKHSSTIELILNKEEILSKMKELEDSGSTENVYN